MTKPLGFLILLLILTAGSDSTDPHSTPLDIPVDERRAVEGMRNLPQGQDMALYLID